MLKIQITKRADGGGVLRCTRQDGSVTWQKQPVRQAAFYALHDLTHYAIESSLGYRNGFYGLIAAGWEIEDTTGKGKRGSIPPEAGEVERLAGLFDMERAGGFIQSAEDFNQFSPRPLTEAELARIRKRRSELFTKWFEVEPGNSLELEFPG